MTSIVAICGHDNLYTEFMYFTYTYILYIYITLHQIMCTYFIPVINIVVTSTNGLWDSHFSHSDLVSECLRYSPAECEPPRAVRVTWFAYTVYAVYRARDMVITRAV